MDIKELQIGDWVLIDKVPRIVEMITKKKVGYHLKEHECVMHYARMVQVSPIPITMEILEKNGMLDGTNWIGSSEIWISKVLGVIEIGVYIEPDYCIDIPLSYVHELQHILSFCKIEKEIIWELKPLNLLKRMQKETKNLKEHYEEIKEFLNKNNN